ncbi:MAG: O-antigen ligase family protein [bacterium]
MQTNIFKWLAPLAAFLPLVASGFDYIQVNFTLTIFFQILVEILALVWIITMVSDNSFRPNFKNPVTVALGLYIFWLAISTFWSVDPAFSFWSTQTRMTGVVQYLHCFVWFLMLSSTLKTWEDWKPTLFAANAVCLLVDAIGFHNFATSMAPLVRETSIMGNAGFLATYALLHVYLAVILFLQAGSRNWKIFYALSVLAHFAIILASGTRAAVLAISLTCILGGIYFLRPKLGERKTYIRFTGVILLIGLAASAFLWLRISAPGKSIAEKFPESIYRIINTDAGGDRKALWRIAIEGIKEKPVLGWGLENYGIVFEKYFRPMTLDSSLRETWYDRAHNQILEIWLALGAIGLLLYLAFWTALIRGLIVAGRLCTSDAEKYSIATLLLCFVAYFLNSFFIFDIPSSLVIFYALLALANSITSNTASAVVLQKKTKNESAADVRAGKTVAVIGLVAVFVVMYKASFLPMYLELKARSGREETFRNTKLSLENYKASLDTIAFTNPENAYHLADTISAAFARSMQSTEILKDHVLYAAPKMAELARAHPQNTRLQIMTAYLYRRAMVYEPALAAESYKYADRALILSPERFESRMEIAETAIEAGEYQKARELIGKAMAVLLPDRFQGLARAHFRLAHIAIKTGEFKVAVSELGLAEKYGIRITDQLQLALGFADALPNSIREPEVLKYFARLDSAMSSDSDAMRAHALVCFKSNDLVNYKKILAKLEVFSPGTARGLKDAVEKIK